MNDGLSKHVQGECNDCFSVYAPLDEMMQIVAKGGIPVLRIQADDVYQLSLSARSADDGAKYVAISHVWTDGFASTTSSTITQCQLTCIADRLGKLELTEDCGDLCFWMDTLCIPVDPAMQQVREAQIRRMHDIYKDAYAVIVMDPDTLSMRQADATVEEIAMRLYISA